MTRKGERENIKKTLSFMKIQYNYNFIWNFLFFCDNIVVFFVQKKGTFSPTNLFKLNKRTKMNFVYERWWRRKEKAIISYYHWAALLCSGVNALIDRYNAKVNASTRHPKRNSKLTLKILTTIAVRKKGRQQER